MSTSTKREKRKRRHRKIRIRVSGTAEIPRLCVFKSTNHIYAQLIDDDSGKTILSACDLEIKKSKRGTKKETKEEKKETKNYGGKKALAFETGQLIAKKALEKKIKKVVFDRGGFAYHGRVRALAEGARKGGLEF